MKKLLLLWLAVAVTGLAVGCGGDSGKGVNQDKDKPVAPGKEKK
jgi:hypothetical protein